MGLKDGIKLSPQLKQDNTLISIFVPFIFTDLQGHALHEENWK